MTSEQEIEEPEPDQHMNENKQQNIKNWHNKALEPTTMPVTFRACAQPAPCMVAAHF
jgi:hypothetical protein